MSVCFIDSDYKYGYHSPKYPTLEKTVEEMSDKPMTAMQIYISNGRSKAPPKCDPVDISRARKLLRKYDLYLVIHGCLLYNLAGTTNHRKDSNFHSSLKSTCTGLIGELDIGAGLGAGVVVHMGSCKDKEKGRYTMARTIEHVLTANSPNSKILAKTLSISPEEFKKRRKIILENSAGEGEKLGSTLKDIGDIISQVDENVRDQVKVCIDTAHGFGAGMCDWGIPSEIDRFYSEFEKYIGLDHLEVFHLNDSRQSTKKGDDAFFGSKKDRHENLGKGYVFGDKHGSHSEEGSRMEGLKYFLLQARKHCIPMIGEPPGKTKHGEGAPGGRRDWGLVCELLESTEYPLEAWE